MNNEQAVGYLKIYAESSRLQYTGPHDPQSTKHAVIHR